MLRQDIIINDYTYLIDLYKAKEDIKHDHYEDYVIMRNIKLINNITYDSDIIFISKSIINQCLTDNKVDIEKLKNFIAWPVTSNENVYFSSNQMEFNHNYVNNDLQYEIYPLYDNSGDECKLLCDKVRIYLPVINPYLKSVICISNYINGMHFYYFCSPFDCNNKLNLYDSNAETDIKVNNTVYNEYFEFWIPNIQYLFEIGNIYFKDDINLYEIKDYNDNIIENSEIFIKPDNKICLSTLLFPFELNSNKKLYRYDIENILYIYKNHPLTITIYPYDTISDSIYMSTTGIDYNSDTFVYDEEFSLIANLMFNNKGQLCVHTDWKYPSYSLDFDDIDNVYKMFNNTKNGDYKSFNELFESYDDDDHKIEINKIGYCIEISSDIKFNNIIYTFNRNLTGPDFIIDSFDFILNEVFDSWNNMVGTYFVRTKFIDRIVNNIIESNILFIDKEHFKYLVNDIGLYKINLNSIPDMNFIDKINATVRVESSDKQHNISTNNIPKIVYKPVFYKVSELQSIRLRAKLKQNIGVDLSELMSKVESFKMIINDQEIVESARTDMYVIFNIDASRFTTNTGSYYIVNQDDEFISDGNWNIY